MPLLQLPGQFRSRRTTANIASTPEGTVDVLDVAGPGCLRKLWFVFAEKDLDDLEIEIDGNTVTVKGKMSSKYCSAKESEYLVRELRQSFFTRTLSIPNRVVGEPEANLADGILTLTWETERAKEPPVKRIEIK